MQLSLIKYNIVNNVNEHLCMYTDHFKGSSVSCSASDFGIGTFRSVILITDTMITKFCNIIRG